MSSIDVITKTGFDLLQMEIEFVDGQELVLDIGGNVEVKVRECPRNKGVLGFFQEDRHILLRMNIQNVPDCFPCTFVNSTDI